LTTLGMNLDLHCEKLATAWAVVLPQRMLTIRFSSLIIWTYLKAFPWSLHLCMKEFNLYCMCVLAYM
jgi:hypothetical protein